MRNCHLIIKTVETVVSGSKNLIHLDQDFNINILMLLIQVCAFSLR